MSINPLEFVVDIINYKAITILLQNNPGLYKHLFPLLLNQPDNMTSKFWMKKTASKTCKGKVLQRIVYSLMMNNSVSLRSNISGSNNVLRDYIISIYSQNNLVISFDKLMQEFSQMKKWSRFYPSQELFSNFCSSLLVGRDPGSFIPKILGHFSQDIVVL